jgi:hypothetical protein
MSMPEAWSPETPKSDEISWDEVFAAHREQRSAIPGKPKTLRNESLEQDPILNALW